MFGLGTKYVTEGRTRMRCPLGHRWWSPLRAGAIVKVTCPSCRRDGESIDVDDEREEWRDDVSVD